MLQVCIIPTMRQLSICKFIHVFNQKHMEDIYRAFIETFTIDTKRFYSTYNRKQETDETKALLDQYCIKVQATHNEFQPQFDYIIGKTVDVVTVRKTYFLYNPYTKEELIVD